MGFFNDKELVRMQRAGDMAFEFGEQTIGKAIYFGTNAVKKTILFLFACVLTIFFFIAGCLSIKKHFKKKE